MIRTLVLVFIAEVWNALGQVLFKKATNGLDFDLRISYSSFLIKVTRRPEVALGLVSMAIGLVAWLAALSNAELSIVFPLGSIQYILIFFAARIFLSERIDAMRIFGTALITAGIVLIALS